MKQQQSKYKKQGVSSTLHLVVGFIAILLITCGFFIVAEYLICRGGTSVYMTRVIFRTICGGLCILGFVMGVIFIAGQRSWDLQGFILHRVDSEFVASMIVALILRKAEVSGWTIVTPWGKNEPIAPTKEKDHKRTGS